MSIRALPISPRLVPRPERVLHLVDVENLAGSPDFTCSDAIATRAAYEAIAPAAPGQQIVIATSHYAAPAAWFAWPMEARRLVRSGVDGADLALCEVLHEEAVETRFDRVVIGSGDGIFAFPAARLQAAGCAVTVVASTGSISRELRLAAGDIRTLAPMQAVLGGAA